MTKQDCVELGYVQKAHGIRGEVKVVFDVHDLNDYTHLKSFLVAKKDENLRAVRVKSMRVLSDSLAIIQFEGSADRNSAEDLKGTALFQPISELPKLPEGQFYYFQVKGFRILDEQLGELGTVKEIIDAPGQDILVMIYQEKEVLIPMTHEFVIKADFEQKAMLTKLPEGLLDIYL